MVISPKILVVAFISIVCTLLTFHAQAGNCRDDQIIRMRNAGFSHDEVIQICGRSRLEAPQPKQKRVPDPHALEAIERSRQAKKSQRLREALERSRQAKKSQRYRPIMSLEEMYERQGRLEAEREIRSMERELSRTR